jgi:hypothetical protein
MSSRPHIQDFLSQTSYGIEVSGILSLRLRVSDAQRLAARPACSLRGTRRVSTLAKHTGECWWVGRDNAALTERPGGRCREVQVSGEESYPGATRYPQSQAPPLRQSHAGTCGDG